jgi:hypothetical protein
MENKTVNKSSLISSKPSPNPLKRAVVLYMCNQGKEQGKEFAANHSPGPT